MTLCVNSTTQGSVYKTKENKPLNVDCHAISLAVPFLDHISLLNKDFDKTKDKNKLAGAFYSCSYLQLIKLDKTEELALASASVGQNIISSERLINVFLTICSTNKTPIKIYTSLAQRETMVFADPCGVLAWEIPGSYIEFYAVYVSIL